MTNKHYAKHYYDLENLCDLIQKRCIFTTSFAFETTAVRAYAKQIKVVNIIIICHRVQQQRDVTISVK